MLARSFLSASDLGISEAHRQALIGVLTLLERHDLKPHEFGMAEWDCGSAACLGGWAERIAPRLRFRYRGWETPPRGAITDGLDKLFYPHRDGCLKAYTATVEEGAQALSNYLTLGEPRWREVMES